MPQSRGTLYFHRLFTVADLGLGSNPEPFVNRVIREFLKIGEALARRWIEMPQGILILQMVPERPDTGAVYLYDRKQHVFYMLGFDGPDDNLTLEEFNQLLADYDLLRFAEQPSLVASEEQAPEAPAPEPPVHRGSSARFDLTVTNCIPFPNKQGLRWHARPELLQFSFQRAGSA